MGIEQRIVTPLLVLLSRAKKAKTAREARHWTEAFKNLVISLAIVLRSRTRFNSLSSLLVAKANGKDFVAAGRAPHLLAAIPKRGGGNIVRRNRVTRARVQRDSHARIANVNIKNVVKHSGINRPNKVTKPLPPSTLQK